MKINRFQKIYSQDQTVNRVQDQIQTIVSQITSIELMDGNLRQDIDLATGSDQIIAHKLGRNYIGWIVTKKNANVDIYESTTTNTRTDKQVIFLATGTVTADIWFF